MIDVLIGVSIAGLLIFIGAWGATVAAKARKKYFKDCDCGCSC